MSSSNCDANSLVLAEMDVRGSDAIIRTANNDDAAGICLLMHEAFSARPAVHPAAAALLETPNSVRDALARGFGVVVERHDEIIGSLIVDETITPAVIERVCVSPSFHRLGIAQAMVDVTLDELAYRNATQALVHARKEFPEIADFWRHQGFVPEGETATTCTLVREISTVLKVESVEAMQELGRKLAQVLRGGDVIIASGELGAGKTTLTQGIGAGLSVSGPIISPTFVLSRIHRNTGTGPALVHVDAYRLGHAAELADLDLDESLAESVTLIEWGAGIAEWLNDDRLEIDIVRASNDTREVKLTPVGPRWQGVLGGIL